MNKRKIILLFATILIALSTFVGCNRNSKKESPLITDNTDVTTTTKAEQLIVKWPYYEIKKDREVKGHLLGTIHLGKEEMYPFPDEMVENLENSKYLVTEIIMKDLQSSETQQILADYMTNSTSINDEIDENTKDKYLSVLENYGYSEDSMKDFNRFGISQMLTAKTSPPLAALYGVEMQIAGINEIENIGLETIDFQFSALSKLSYEPENISDWIDNIPSLEDATKDTEKLLQSYIDGDVISKYETPEILGVSQNYYDILLTNRNKNWMEQLPKYLESENNSFIAVGAGHLSGDNGLLKLLNDMGYETNLVEFK